MALAVRLVPYVVLVLAYVLAFDIVHQYPPETVPAALSKATPVWYLTFFVTRMNPNSPGEAEIAVDEFRSWIALGLLLSSLGDVSLVWRDALFIPGMLFFALAHVCYIVGLKVKLTNSQAKGGAHGNLFALLGACSFLFVLSGIESWVMTGLVLLYTALLFWMGHLSFRRYQCERSPPSFYGALGAACFLVSDFLIAVQKWKLSLPMSEFLIMATYYAAQLGIAVSTTSARPGTL